MLKRLHSEPALKGARNPFKVEVGVVLDADGGRAISSLSKANAAGRKSRCHVFFTLASRT